jgi:hypothetical protein
VTQNLLVNARLTEIEIAIIANTAVIMKEDIGDANTANGTEYSGGICY